MVICHTYLNKSFRGSGRQTELLVRCLAKRGFLQTVILRRGGPLQARLADVESVKIVDIGKPFFLHPKVCSDAALIHAHSGQGAGLGALSSALYGTPLLITRRVDNPIKDNVVNRLVCGRACCIVAISRVVQARVLEFDSDASAPIISGAKANLPVRAEAVQSLQERYKGKFVVGHTGELANGHKGQLYLIRAARRLKEEAPDIHFLLLGQGEDEAMLKKEADGLLNVEFGGFVDNVGDYLSVLNVFAYPSLHEGMGSAILDAMALGLPIVASNVGGIPDIVEHEANGLLVPPGDSDALAEAIMRVYRNTTLRTEMGRVSRERAKLYTPERMTDKYVELYEEIMK